MPKGRLEAFSDGVIAVIITIMVLELKVPHGADSATPFVTGWMDENHFAPLTVAAYGAVLLASAISYQILTAVLRAAHPADSLIARALGSDRKGKLSLLAYVVAASSAFLDIRISLGGYVAVALLWLVPDRRFERLLAEHKR